MWRKPSLVSVERPDAELRAWDLDADVGHRLGGGNRSEVWRACVRREQCTVRLSRRSPEALTWELDLIEYLGAQGIGVPRVVRALSGERELNGLFVLSWVDGHPPATDAEWRRVAEELTQVHRLTAEWPQRPAFASTLDLLTSTTGGDIDLAVMPDYAVERCREAWMALAGEPTSAIHGDPKGNVLITDSGPAFIDWDEARVDASVLDLADLPLRDQSDRMQAARRAANAWEAANAWTMEPQYARRRLNQLG
jgi:Ser/Thr protein kinase RdoA (MazF antagonist)